MGVANGTWCWKDETLKVYESSPGQKRFFVEPAGRQLPIRPNAGLTKFICAALLDEPQSFAPNEHYHWAERLHWAATTDDLPKNEGTISELSGEGTTN